MMRGVSRFLFSSNALAPPACDTDDDSRSQQAEKAVPKTAVATLEPSLLDDALRVNRNGLNVEQMLGMASPVKDITLVHLCGAPAGASVEVQSDGQAMILEARHHDLIKTANEVSVHKVQGALQLSLDMINFADAAPAGTVPSCSGASCGLVCGSASPTSPVSLSAAADTRRRPPVSGWRATMPGRVSVSMRRLPRMMRSFLVTCRITRRGWPPSSSSAGCSTRKAVPHSGK